MALCVLRRVDELFQLRERHRVCVMAATDWLVKPAARRTSLVNQRDGLGQFGRSVAACVVVLILLTRVAFRCSPVHYFLGRHRARSQCWRCGFAHHI
jgi:ribosomal protein S27AE